jgi:Predicted membrane protein (DUF2079)
VNAATATASAHAEPGTPSAQAGPLRLVRRIGYVFLCLQLAGFLAWSTILYRRFALSLDFAQFNQAWFLMKHGNLDPFDTVMVYPFWQDHGAFILWPLASLYWAWPHGVLLLWMQDVGVTVAEAVIFTWLCELAGRHRPGRDAAWLAGAGLVLLLANPWMWWAVTFDFHIESLAVPFAALLAWDLANGRRRAWVWVAPLLACGDVAGTYLAGIGLGSLLAGRRSRLRGALMACLGVAAVLLITLVHGNKGSGGSLQVYAYLAAGPPDVQLSLAALAKGIALHPVGVLRVLWAKRLGVWANVAPSGLLGAGFVYLLPLSAIVLLSESLYPGWGFVYPSFQSLPLYVVLPVGTVATLAWLTRRHRRVALLLTGVVVVQAVAWAVVWMPRTPAHWLRVSGPTAATLARVEARIPASAGVIASQGVMGRFSAHHYVKGIQAPGALRVDGETWFVIAPLAGVESETTASAMALAGELAGPMHATLVTHADRVWAFRWRPPPGVHTVTVPGESATLPVWAAPLAPGSAALPVMTGAMSTWHLASTGGRGYIADGLAWQERPGRYTAFVTLSATGPVNVEVWNDTGNTLLARRTIPATSGVESVAVPADATTAFRPKVYSGWGPFSGTFIPPPEGDRLEIRVWSPGDETVNVYRAELEAGSAPARAAVRDGSSDGRSSG